MNNTKGTLTADEKTISIVLPALSMLCGPAARGTEGSAFPDVIETCFFESVNLNGVPMRIPGIGGMMTVPFPLRKTAPQQRMSWAFAIPLRIPLRTDGFPLRIWNLPR